MLAYAIWYVTVVNVDNDYSFLTLGVITGATAVSVIGLHEWMRSQAGPDRPENPIEEYGGAIAVLMGALSVVWLSRFAVFYAGQEKDWIAIQDGEVWMPVWLAALQAVGILVVMEISTRNIRRHSLGTLPRTVVVLAPLAVLFSGVKIWLEYSRGEVETFITLSVVLLSGSAVLYSLRLDRAILYLMSSGAAVGLPIFIALSSWGATEHASLLVPAVVIVGITATDRSLSKKMIENGSGAVVAAILFCQILAADETQFSIAGNAISLALGRPPSRLVRTNDDAENPCYASGAGTGTGTPFGRGCHGSMVSWNLCIRIPGDPSTGTRLGREGDIRSHGGLMDRVLVHRCGKGRKHTRARVFRTQHSRWDIPSDIPIVAGSGSPS